jgi:hypothetical protein
MKLASRISVLSCALFMLALPARAIDGVFTVVEDWSVRIQYYEFGRDDYSGSKRFHGRQTGTVVIRDGHYRLTNRTGLQFGSEDDLLERTITTDPDFGGFYIEGGEPFLAAPGRAYGIIFLGCFAVKVPLLAGEVPPFEDGFFYSAYGDSSSEISGAGEVTDGGETMTVVVSSTLSLRPQSTTSTERPRIATQPRDATVDYGRQATLAVHATGAAPLTFQWWKNGAPLENANEAQLIIDPATTEDSGTYAVIVSNEFGSITSAGAMLTVRPPVPPAITKQPPVSRIVKADRPLKLNSHAKGSRPLAYQWFFEGVAAVGANTNKLFLPAAQLDNAGNYFLVVTNAAGSVTSRVTTVTVKTPAH